MPRSPHAEDREGGASVASARRWLSGVGAAGRHRVPMLVLALSAGLVLLAMWLFATSPSARLARQKTEVLTAHADGRVGALAPVVVVDAIEVRPRDARVAVEISGVLEPARRVTVGAEVGGRVVEVAAVEHRQVAEGDLLVGLDPALPEAAARRARAGLLRAQAAGGLARSEFRRQSDLSTSGVASTAEFDRAQTEARSSEAQIAEARAALVEAETRLAKTRIVAPFAAVVTRLDLEPGAYLHAGDAVAELVDLSEIEIEIGVDDRQILALRRGDAVRVQVDAWPGEWFDGRIHELGSAPDDVTRKYPVPVRVPNAEGRLLPGMLGSVHFSLGEAGPALRIPARAVQREFDLDYVYLLETEAGSEDVAVAQRRRVRTRSVAFRPDLLEVVEGLGGGERIATSGLRELRDGLRVRVRANGEDPARPRASDPLRTAERSR